MLLAASDDATRLELGSSFALINPHETMEIIDLSKLPSRVNEFNQFNQPFCYKAIGDNRLNLHEGFIERPKQNDHFLKLHELSFQLLVKRAAMPPRLKLAARGTVGLSKLGEANDPWWFWWFYKAHFAP